MHFENDYWLHMQHGLAPEQDQVHLSCKGMGLTDRTTANSCIQGSHIPGIVKFLFQ